MKFAVIGRTQMLYSAAKLFVENGHKLVFVATAKAAPEYTKGPWDFEQLAKESGAFFTQGTALCEYAQQIKETGAEIAISMNWPAILDKDILELFEHGVLNAHPGDLPKYRGNACPNWAIINGESQVVLSIHKMQAKELDSGDILLKTSIKLTKDISIGQVYQRLHEIMPPMFLKAAEGILSGNIIPKKQVGNILRVYPRLPQDGLIDWSKSADYLSRLVRASALPFAGAYSHYNRQKIKIWAANKGEFTVPSQAMPGQVVAINLESGAVSVACGSGFLSLLHVEYQGRNYNKPAELISSMRVRLGMVADDEICLLREEILLLRQEIDLLKAKMEDL